MSGKKKNVMEERKGRNWDEGRGKKNSLRRARGE
jgi:hypothetical protein